MAPFGGRGVGALLQSLYRCSAIPQQIELEKALTNCATEIQAYIGRQPDPEHEKWNELRGQIHALNKRANRLSKAIVTDISTTLAESVRKLTGKIGRAQKMIKQIEDTKKFPEITAAVVGVAAKIVTGAGILAAVSNVAVTYVKGSFLALSDGHRRANGSQTPQRKAT